jgi:hypothetical protein
MRRLLKACAVVVFGALVLPLQTGAADNPYKSAKVGAWVEYVTTTESLGTKHEMKTKQTVVAKDDVSVTVRIVATVMGREMPPHDSKIMFDKPYDPYTQGNTDAKVTVLGEGDETITVDGKSYPCHWGKARVVATKPVAMESTVKAWTSKDVPVGGMVKMEGESVMTMEGRTMNSTMTMRLTGSGN